MRGGSRLGLGLAVGLALLLNSFAARGATVTVDTAANTSVSGDGSCTLREALNNANADGDTTEGDCAAGSGPDVIELPALHYLLSMPLDVFSPVTFHGPGSNLASLDGQNLTALMLISPSAGSVRIEGLALTRANGTGAIRNVGAAVTLVDTDLSANVGAPGAAITSLAGSLTIERSVLRGNLGQTSSSGCANSAGAI